MLCKRFKEICDEQGWTVSDNGSDPNYPLQAKQAGFYLQFSGKPQKFC